LGGKVIIAGTVETSGKIDDLWITQGTGFHLDESAARAVSQYVFTPATCHSEPVAADLHLEVNFDIF
jgi:TonB family protein